MNPAAGPLADLRPIHAAPPPELWPPAPGWWLLAVLLLAVLLVAVAWGWRRYREYRFRRKVLHEIDQISNRYSETNSADYLSEIGVLLRRIALQRYPAEQVASLTGGDWLQFLDSTGGDGGFSNGVGRVLESAPYRPRVDAVPVAELATLVRGWAKRNLGRTA